MIVYDFSSQSVVNSNLLWFAVILVFFGFYAYLLSLYKSPQPSGLSAFLFSFQGLTIEQSDYEGKLIGRAMCILSFAGALLISGIQLKSYVYVKHVNWFEEIKTVNGKITKIESVKAFGAPQETFTLNEKEYSITRDKRYVSDRNLSVNDSISVNFFENNEIVEVVKIKLHSFP